MHTIDDLLTIMTRLRDPETGCPWDVKQTFASIAPCTLEEAYEVVDAISRHDLPHLEEELGDLLLQVVFHSQMGREVGAFNFESVVTSLANKLLRRHPHVFPDGTLNSRVSEQRSQTHEVKDSWEKIKADERVDKGKQGLLDDIPLALPALKRAQKLQKRAAKVGFDWPALTGVTDKLEEELHELNRAVEQGDPALQLEELGDVLFTAVNMARHLGLDAEEALRRANSKFQSRFETMEKAFEKAGVAPEDQSPDSWDYAWEAAKAER